MLNVTKNDTPYQENDWYSLDEPPPYQERRQKDMGPDNPYYHWDVIDDCDDE